jgi:hypothetical protein
MVQNNKTSTRLKRTHLLRILQPAASGSGRSPRPEWVFGMFKSNQSTNESLTINSGIPERSTMRTQGWYIMEDIYQQSCMLFQSSDSEMRWFRYFSFIDMFMCLTRIWNKVKCTADHGLVPTGRVGFGFQSYQPCWFSLDASFSSESRPRSCNELQIKTWPVAEYSANQAISPSLVGMASLLTCSSYEVGSIYFPHSGRVFYSEVSLQSLRETAVSTED